MRTNTSPLLTLGPGCCQRAGPSGEGRRHSAWLPLLSVGRAECPQAAERLLCLALDCVPRKGQGRPLLSATTSSVPAGGRPSPGPSALGHTAPDSPSGWPTRLLAPPSWPTLHLEARCLQFSKAPWPGPCASWLSAGGLHLLTYPSECLPFASCRAQPQDTRARSCPPLMVQGGPQTRLPGLRGPVLVGTAFQPGKENGY